jgi:hypothetical protein
MDGAFSALPEAVFSTDLNNVSTAFLKRPDLPETQDNKRQYSRALLKTAEALVLMAA